MGRSIPSPSPVQDLQTGCPWNVALQITQGTLRTEEAQSLRRCSSPLPEGQEAGCSPRHEIHLLGTWSKYCTVGRISHEVGWKYRDVVQTLENKRKLKASVAYGKKGVYKKTKRAAFLAVAPRIAAHQKVVHELGHK